MAQNNITNIFAKKKLFFSGVLLAIFIAFCDLLTKELVFHLIQEKSGGNRNFYIEITGFFNLVKVWNYGVSFGMFSDAENTQIIFSVLVSIISLIILIWLYRNEKPLIAYALSFVLGGALGNLADRINHGAVADFLDFHAFGYHWPAFNLADSFVFIGVAILIFEDLLISDKK